MNSNHSRQGTRLPKILSKSIVRRVTRVVPTLACFALGMGAAHGASLYWDTNGNAAGFGASATGTWGSSAFWSTDPTGSSATTTTLPTNADDVTISNSSGGTVTISGGENANSITLGSASAITLAPGTSASIDLGSATGGSGIFATTAANNTISTPIVLDSLATAVSFSNTSTGTLTISGNVTGNATSGTQLLTVANGSGGVVVSGVIADGSAGGNIALSKTGTGTLTLSKANTYTAGTTVSAGTLKLDFSAASAATTNILASSGALTLAGGNLTLTGKASTTNSQTLSGLTLSAGTASSITLTANGTANPLALTLGGINRNAGATVNFTLPTGTISATNGINIPSGTANTILTDASGAAYATVGGTDWAARDSSGTSVVGLSTISGGYTAFGTTGSVTLNGNADLSNAGAGGTYTVQSGSNPLTIRAVTATTSGSNTLALNGQTLTLAGYLANQNLTISGAGALKAAIVGGELVLNQLANTTSISSAILDNSASALTKAGAGTVILSGANNYTGGTMITAGTLNVGSAGALGSSGTISFTGGTLQHSSSNTTDYSGRFSNAAGQLYSVDTNGQNVTWATGLTSFGGTLTKLNTGTLTLSGTNSYTGGTTVSAGYLVFNGGTAVPSAGTITPNGTGALVASGAQTSVMGWLNSGHVSTTSTGTIAITGNSAETIDFATGGFNNLGLSSTGTATYSGSITAGTGGYKFSGDVGTLTVSSNLTQSALALTKLDANTLTLSGANSYTGGTAVSGGTVNVQGDQSAANGGWSISWVSGGSTTVNFPTGSTVSVVSGKSITMSSGSPSSQTASLNVSGTVTDNGSLSMGRSGVLTLSSGANWTQNGSMSIATSSSTFGSATVTLSGGTFTYAGSSAITMTPSNNSSGGASLNIAGGTLITGKGISDTGNGAGTGTANLVFSSGGTLKLSANIGTLATSSGSGTASVFNIQTGTGGGNIDTNGFSTTITQGITSTGSLTKQGLGTLTLSGTNTYSGGTTVNAGYLTFSNLTAVPATGTINANGSGAIVASGAQTTVTGWLSSGAINTASTGSIAITGDSSENIDFTGFNNLGLSSTGSATYSGTITPGTGGYKLGGDAGNLTVNSVLNGSLGLTKIGAGTVTLSGGSTYTGATNVNGGTLVVSGSLSGTASTTVASGATLASGATGSITTAAAGNISVSGTLAPGAIGSIGTLTLAPGTGGKLSFASGSTLALDISGTNSDQVAFSTSGDWLLGSGNVTLSLSGLTAANYTNTYTIFSNVTTSGFNFASITGYDTNDYLAKVTQSGSNYQLSFAPIPEPTAAVSLLGGMGLLLGWQRRQRVRK